MSESRLGVSALSIASGLKPSIVIINAYLAVPSEYDNTGNKIRRMKIIKNLIRKMFINRVVYLAIPP